MRICREGHFESEFLLELDDQTLSLGDYIEVIPLGQPVYTGEDFDAYGGRKLSVYQLPLNVVTSCLTEPIECFVKGPLTITMRHWIDSLEIGVKSTVVGVRFTHGEHVWYMPKIDGNLPHRHV